MLRMAQAIMVPASNRGNPVTPNPRGLSPANESLPQTIQQIIHRGRQPAPRHTPFQSLQASPCFVHPLELNERLHGARLTLLREAAIRKAFAMVVEHREGLGGPMTY